MLQRAPPVWVSRMIDPITAVALKTGTSWLAAQFKHSVIERWSRRRAEAFFQTFVQHVAAADREGEGLHGLEPMLAAIIEDDVKSEVLFDAYRKVCLSASASIGPRVIAVVTARLVIQGRAASPEEECLLMAAEMLSDSDFAELCDYLSQHTPSEGAIKLFDESEDSNWRTGSISIGPADLGEFVGNWCVRLASIGLAAQEIQKELHDYRADSERHIDEDGTLTTYTWNLVLRSEVLELKRIVEELR